MVKVYAAPGRSLMDNVISDAEAETWNFDVTGLKLASIETLRKLAERDLGSTFGGPIQVAEGVFEFDYDTCTYEEVEYHESKL